MNAARPWLLLSIFTDALSQVKALLAENGDMQELHAKYCQRLLESYIDDNKRVKWCPSTPHCGRAVQASRACSCVLCNNFGMLQQADPALLPGPAVQATGAARHADAVQHWRTLPLFWRTLPLSWRTLPLSVQVNSRQTVHLADHGVALLS